MYDHKHEVESARARARAVREAAARALAEAVARHAASLREAAELDAQAAHVHRLCTRGGDVPCCGLLPGESRASAP